MTTVRECEHGFHAPLVAMLPLESEDGVEIDYVCPRCRQVEYTVSYGKDAWAREVAKRTPGVVNGDR